MFGTDPMTFGPFIIDVKRGELSYTLTERWVHTGRSHSVSCGASSEMEVVVQNGVAVEELKALSASLEGMLGSKDIASIGSKIEEKLERKISLSTSESIRDTFLCAAPECGKKTYSLFQYVRDHAFTFTRKRIFRKDVVRVHNVREFSQEFDLRTTIDHSHPHCPCPEEKVTVVPKVAIQIGNLTLQLVGRLREEGLVEIRLGSTVFEYSKESFGIDGEHDDDDRLPRSIVVQDGTSLFPHLTGVPGPVVIGEIIGRSVEISSRKLNMAAYASQQTGISG